MDTLKQAVAPPGQRPPFTEQLTKREAVAFWQQHRYDSTGAEVLARMKPADILELDTALAGMNAATQF
jgi:hypothetical protein